MDELLAFLNARLDEDEAIARVATAGVREWDDDALSVLSDWRRCEYFCLFAPDSKSSRGTPRQPGHEHRYTDELTVRAVGYDDPYVEVAEADAIHIARFQPARVLREVAAKRAILAEHYPVDPCDAHDSALRTVVCGTVAALAAIYSDHPDFDPSWEVQ